MEREQIAYFQPRVMRHTDEAGQEEYAIHDVYFGECGQVVTYTEDALSSREASVASLKAILSGLLEHEEVPTGDLGYIYSHEDIQEWLRNIDEPPINY